MMRLFISRPTIVWVVLLALTGLSWAVGHVYGGSGMRYAGVCIIVVAFLKVRLVILEFMEIRHAPLPMRLAGEVWVIALCVTLTTLYVRAPH
jgi:hypothetical protein